jgi:hypothetical protein
MFVADAQSLFLCLKYVQGMWADNGHSARIGETISNRQTHSFGLSTPVIDCAWWTAGKSCTVYSVKTYANNIYCFVLGNVTVSEIGRCILACLC